MKLNVIDFFDPCKNWLHTSEPCEEGKYRDSSMTWCGECELGYQTNASQTSCGKI